LNNSAFLKERKALARFGMRLRGKRDPTRRRRGLSESSPTFSLFLHHGIATAVQEPLFRVAHIPQPDGFDPTISQSFRAALRFNAHVLAVPSIFPTFIRTVFISYGIFPRCMFRLHRNITVTVSREFICQIRSDIAFIKYEFSRIYNSTILA